MSKRVENWLRFSDTQMLNHLEKYCDVQYGPVEAETVTAAECIHNIHRYVTRFGKNVRGETEQMRDLLKIAHYAQMAHDRLIKDLGVDPIYQHEWDKRNKRSEIFSRGMASNMLNNMTKKQEVD